MSQNESHGQPCDIISRSRRRNDKSIRRRKERKTNCNIARFETVCLVLALAAILVYKAESTAKELQSSSLGLFPSKIDLVPSTP